MLPDLKELMQPLTFPAPGTVYGVILNDRDTLDRIGAALDAAPYKAHPAAPVLYIKPETTLAPSGAVLTLPAGAEALEVGATIGVCFGVAAARVTAAEADAVIAGYRVVADLSLPHSSYYRPAIREKCFDDSCVLGSELSLPADLATLSVVTKINGVPADSWQLADLVRTVPQLIEEISSFMTFEAGDMLLVGVKWQAPQARAGDMVSVSVAGIGSLDFSLTAGAGVQP